MSNNFISAHKVQVWDERHPRLCMAGIVKLKHQRGYCQLPVDDTALFVKYDDGKYYYYYATGCQLELANFVGGLAKVS